MSATQDFTWARTRYVDHAQPRVFANLAYRLLLHLARGVTQELSSATQSVSPALSLALPASVTTQPHAQPVFRDMCSSCLIIPASWQPVSRPPSTPRPSTTVPISNWQLTSMEGMSSLASFACRDTDRLSKGVLPVSLDVRSATLLTSPAASNVPQGSSWIAVICVSLHLLVLRTAKVAQNLVAQLVLQVTLSTRTSSVSSSVYLLVQVVSWAILSLAHRASKATS